MGCGGTDQATGPGDPGPIEPAQRVATGDTIEGRFERARQIRSYSFLPGGTGETAVFVSVDTGTVRLAVRDSVSGNRLGEAVAYDWRGPSVVSTRTPTFTVSPKSVCVVTIRLEEGESGTFRFLVYPVDRATEDRASTYQIGDAGEGETLETSADIDEFTFEAAAGEELIAFARPLTPGTGAGAFQVRIQDAAGADLAVTPSGAADDPPGSLATGRFLIGNSGLHRLTVSADPFGSSYRIPYRFEVLRIDRSPEGAPSTVPLGDTVNAAIDFTGDIDEFTVAGAPGAELDLFFQSLQETGEDAFLRRLHLEVPSAGILLEAPLFPPDTGLLAVHTRALTLPESGTLAFQVRGRTDRDAPAYGPYRFFVYPIDRRPETLAGQIALGETIEGESIDHPSDVDEFTFDLSAPSGANLVLDRPSVGPGGIVVQLLQPPAVGPLVDLRASIATPDARVAAGRLDLDPGSYLLRIFGTDDGAEGWQGSYRVVTLGGFDSNPESVPATIAIGETVSAEELTPLGDSDLFRFTGEQGRLINVIFQGTGEPAEHGYSLVVRLLGADALAVVYAPRGGVAWGERQTGRFRLPATAEYELEVTPENGGTILEEEGPYRFAVLPFDASPETVAPAIAVGDTVREEKVDYLGDMDEFELAGTPGESVVVYLLAPSGNLRVEVLDAAGRTILGTTTSAGGAEAAGPFAIPPEGRLLLQVGEPRFAEAFEDAFSRSGDSFTLWTEAQ